MWARQTLSWLACMFGMPKSLNPTSGMKVGGILGSSEWAGTWNTSLPVGTLSALSPSAEFWAAAVTPSHRQNMIPLMGLHNTADTQRLPQQHHTGMSFAMQSDHSHVMP